MAKLLPVNLVCPRCGNSNYMCWLNDASKEYGLKCTNCNTYWKLSVVTHLPNTDVGEFDKDTNVPVKYDHHEFFHHKKPTNADKIRAYTDLELAMFMTAVAQKSAEKLCESLKTVDVDLSNCDFGILAQAHLDWLQQEATT